MPTVIGGAGLGGAGPTQLPTSGRFLSYDIGSLVPGSNKFFGAAMVPTWSAKTRAYVPRLGGPLEALADLQRSRAVFAPFDADYVGIFTEGLSTEAGSFSFAFQALDIAHAGLGAGKFRGAAGLRVNLAVPVEGRKAGNVIGGTLTGWQNVVVFAPSSSDFVGIYYDDAPIRGDRHRPPPIGLFASVRL